MKIVRMAILGLALLNWGCASNYGGADLGTPSAELSLVKGYGDVAWNRAAAQEYVFDDDIQCKNPRRLARFIWATGDRRATRIPAGERIVLLARTNYLQSAPGQSNGVGIVIDLYSKDCENMTSFVPEAGRSYVVSQQARVGQCSISVIDTATGVAPPSVEDVPPGGCELYFPAHPALH